MPFTRVGVTASTQGGAESTHSSVKRQEFETLNNKKSSKNIVVGRKVAHRGSHDTSSMNWPSNPKMETEQGDPTVESWSQRAKDSSQMTPAHVREEYTTTNSAQRAQFPQNRNTIYGYTQESPYAGEVYYGQGFHA